MVRDGGKPIDFNCIFRIFSEDRSMVQLFHESEDFGAFTDSPLSIEIENFVDLAVWQDEVRESVLANRIEPRNKVVDKNKSAFAQPIRWPNQIIRFHHFEVS